MSAELRKHVRDELLAITQVAHALRRKVPGIGLLKMPVSTMQAEALLKLCEYTHIWLCAGFGDWDWRRVGRKVVSVMAGAMDAFDASPLCPSPSELQLHGIVVASRELIVRRRPVGTSHGGAMGSAPRMIDRPDHEFACCNASGAPVSD